MWCYELTMIKSVVRKELGNKKVYETEKLLAGFEPTSTTSGGALPVVQVIVWLAVECS